MPRFTEIKELAKLREYSGSKYSLGVKMGGCGEGSNDVFDSFAECVASDAGRGANGRL